MKTLIKHLVGATLAINSLVAIAGELVGTEAARERMYPNVVPPDRIIGGYGGRAGDFLQIRRVIFKDESNFLVADCAANRIQEFDLDGSLKSTIAHECPTDLAIAGANLYVFSELAGTISLYGVKNRRFVRSWQVPVHGDKQIAAIAASDKYLFAVPRFGGQVVVYDRFGRPLRHFRLPNTSRVSSAAAEGDRLFLADKLGARVYSVNIHNGNIQHFGEFGTYAGEMANPHGIEVKNSNIYVVDTVNHRIQQFDTNGKYVLQFGRHPVSPHETTMGRMHYPHHIAVNSTGTSAVVCEPYESRCNLFSLDKVQHAYTNSSESAWWNKFFYFHYRAGASKARMSETRIPMDSDLMFMAEEDIHRIVISKFVDGVPQTVTAFGEFGTAQGQFKGPEGVFPGPEGNLYVSDTGNHRIQVFDFQGNFKFQFGEFGNKPGQLNAPGQGSTDADGNVYISDSGNGRVQVFDSSGKFLRVIGMPGTKSGQFLRPIDAHFDKKRNRLMVVDIFNKRVATFDQSGKFLFNIGGPNQLVAPHSVVVDDDSDSIFVSDMVANMIMKYDLKGKLQSRIGNYGIALGEYKTPAGMAVLNGRVHVMDHTNHRGQVFDARTGNTLFAFGEGVIGVPGDVLQVRKSLEEMSDALKQPSPAGEDPGIRLQQLQRDIEGLKLQLNKPLMPRN